MKISLHQSDSYELTPLFSDVAKQGGLIHNGPRPPKNPPAAGEKLILKVSEKISETFFTILTRNFFKITYIHSLIQVDFVKNFMKFRIIEYISQ